MLARSVSSQAALSSAAGERASATLTPDRRRGAGSKEGVSETSPAKALATQRSGSERAARAEVHSSEAALRDAMSEISALHRKLDERDGYMGRDAENSKLDAGDGTQQQQPTIDMLRDELKRAQAHSEEMTNRYLGARREVDDLQEQNVNCNVRIVELKEVLAEYAANCTEMQGAANGASPHAMYNKAKNLLRKVSSPLGTSACSEGSDDDVEDSSLHHRIRALRDELRRVRSLREQESAVAAACQREAKRHMNELIVENEELRAQLAITENGQEEEAAVGRQADAGAFQKMLKDREECIDIVMGQLEEAWAENEAAHSELENIPMELDALAMQDEQKDSIIAGLQAAINDAERTIVSFQDGQASNRRMREELVCRRNDVRSMRRALRSFTREVERGTHERNRLRRALRSMENNYRDLMDDNERLQRDLEAQRARSSARRVGGDLGRGAWSSGRGSHAAPAAPERRVAEEAPSPLASRAAPPMGQQQQQQQQPSVSQRVVPAVPIAEMAADVSRVSASNSGGACVSTCTPSINMADLPPSNLPESGMPAGVIANNGLPWELEQPQLAQQEGCAAIPAGAHVLMTVHDISCIMHNGEPITEAGVIYAKIKSIKEKYTTSVMDLAPIVRFDESFAFYLAHPEEDFLKVFVFYKSSRSHREVFVGKAYFCLRELYRGVPHRRAVPIVQNAATCSARRAGMIEVTLQTDDYGCPLPMTDYDSARERERFDRFVRRLEMDEPEKLHLADMHH